MIYLSYLLALLIGLSIGIMGSGGAILAVPILYYIAGYTMQEASVYSLFVVGASSLVGAVRSWMNRLINWHAVLFFGIPSVLAVYITRLLLVPVLPDPLITSSLIIVPLDMALLLLFAILMVLAARSMLLSKDVSIQGEFSFQSSKSSLQVIAFGLLVGTLTAILGAGGGFLIIPALVLFLGMPMKHAIGTSMFIVAMNALNGFAGSLYKGNITIDYSFLLLFTAMAFTGLFLGMYWAKHLKPEKLKRYFAYFVLLMGLFIILQQLVKHFK